MNEFERFKNRKCIYCGMTQEIATSLGQPEHIKPKEEDVSMCIDCGSLMVFTANDEFRLPTSEELEIFENDPRVIAAKVCIAKRPKTGSIH